MSNTVSVVTMKKRQKLFNVQQTWELFQLNMPHVSAMPVMTEKTNITFETTKRTTK